MEVRRGEKGQHRERTARFDAQKEKGGSDTNSGDRTRGDRRGSAMGSLGEQRGICCIVSKTKTRWQQHAAMSS